MKSIDVTEAKARFDELLEEAQRQPIVIRQGCVDCAIVLSEAIVSAVDLKCGAHKLIAFPGFGNGVGRLVRRFAAMRL